MTVKNILRGPAWIFGIIMILYAILAWLVPLCIDDYMYINRWNDATGNAGFGLEAFVKFIKTNRNCDNFRIANMMAPFMVYFKFTRFFYPLLTGISMGVIIYASAWLSASGSWRVLFSLSILIWLMMILFLPWQWLFVADYAINYIWGAAINLTTILLLLRLLKRRNCGMLWKSLLLMLAFIAGGWHEGFALPTVTGLVLYILAKSGKLPTIFYYYLSVYTIGTLFFLWSPGLWSRIGETVRGISFIENPYYLVVIVLLVGLLTLCSVMERGKVILKKVWKNPVFIIGLGIITAGLMMAMMTDNSPRCYFWCDLMAIICISAIVNCSGILEKKPLFIRIAILISFGICIVQTFLCITFQNEVKKENENLMTAIASNDTGIVFYDLDNFKETPWYCAHIPVNNFWESPWHYLVLRRFFEKDYFSVVPKTLAQIRIDYMRPLRVAPAFYEIDGHIVSENYIVSEWSRYNLGTDELKMPEEKILRIDVNENFRVDSRVNVYPFITEPYLHSDKSVRPDTLLYYKSFKDLVWR